jgi:hypothetical protein
MQMLLCMPISAASMTAFLKSRSTTKATSRIIAIRQTTIEVGTAALRDQPMIRKSRRCLITK